MNFPNQNFFQQSFRLLNYVDKIPTNSETSEFDLMYMNFSKTPPVGVLETSRHIKRNINKGSAPQHKCILNIFDIINKLMLHALYKATRRHRCDTIYGAGMQTGAKFFLIYFIIVMFAGNKSFFVVHTSKVNVTRTKTGSCSFTGVFFISNIPI